MPKKSNFCETHNQIHHCEFTSVTFVAKKQEELISKRMNRLLNPSQYIKPSENVKPKKGSFAHIIQHAKTKNQKLKSEVNFLAETKDDKIDEKTLTNRIEQLKKSVLQDSNSSDLQTNKKTQKNSNTKKTKKEENDFLNPSSTIQLTVEQTQELIDKAVKKALKDFKTK